MKKARRLINPLVSNSVFLLFFLNFQNVKFPNAVSKRRSDFEQLSADNLQLPSVQKSKSKFLDYSSVLPHLLKQGAI